MRHFWATLAVSGGIALLCWFGFFRANCDPAAHAAAREGDTLAWLRCEFRLTETQYAEIRRLHAAHRVVCVGHCDAVRVVRERLAAARRAGDAPASAAAERDERAAVEVCRIATEAHVRQVAAVMGPEEGRRYLAMVLPRLAQLDHQGPPGLTLEGH